MDVTPEGLTSLRFLGQEPESGPLVRIDTPPGWGDLCGKSGIEFPSPHRLRPPDLATLAAWEEEGYCEAIDGCVVEPEGTNSHSCNSWLLELGLI